MLCKPHCVAAHRPSYKLASNTTPVFDDDDDLHDEDKDLNIEKFNMNMIIRSGGQG